MLVSRRNVFPVVSALQSIALILDAVDVDNNLYVAIYNKIKKNKNYMFYC